LFKFDHKACTTSGSLWKLATYSKENKVQAQDKLYAVLVALYQKAYDAWEW
jgi:hypothetical protein